MPRAIIMTDLNLQFITDNSGCDLFTHECNLEEMRSYQTGAVYVIVDGSKETNNLCCSWWTEADISRNWKFDDIPSTTEFVNLSKH